MECGLIREDQLPNYPDYLIYGQELPEPLEAYTVKDDIIRTLQRELDELRKEMNDEISKTNENISITEDKVIKADASKNEEFSFFEDAAVF